MLPTDPLGAKGPRLDKFLRFWLYIQLCYTFLCYNYVKETFGKIKKGLDKIPRITWSFYLYKSPFLVLTKFESHSTSLTFTIWKFRQSR